MTTEVQLTLTAAEMVELGSNEAIAARLQAAGIPVDDLLRPSARGVLASHMDTGKMHMTFVWKPQQ